MSASGFWIVLFVVGAGTVLLRVSPIVTHGKASMPKAVERLLRHVPAAALTAIVVPAVLFDAEGTHVYSLDPARIVAGLAALVVALRTKSTILTIATGMGGLWILTALLG